MIHGIDAGLRLADSVARYLAGEIAQAGGTEVFAVGRMGDSGLVETAEVLARGDEDEVPAIVRVPRPGEVVIHNHPGGDLRPSKPDLAIASELGDSGVGFYIIDNKAARLFEVVAAFRERKTERLDEDALAAMISPGGLAASKIEDFEHRPAQVDMLRRVAAAFNHDGVVVVEAGTGTGKSMAYLIPAVLWATTNRERVVVSTHTINLQEQILLKDLPLLAEKVGLRFEAVLVKGRGNYLCRRKAAAMRQQGLALTDADRVLADLLTWADATTDGSLSDLNFTPPPDIWDELMVEADQCGRARCPFYNTCFFYNARRKAAKSDILVANHHILMADLAVREAQGFAGQGILPGFTRVIVDEAHHIEDVATNYFGADVTRFGLQRLLGRLVRRRGSDEKGLVMRLFRNLGTLQVAPERRRGLADFLNIDLKGLTQETAESADRWFDRIAEAARALAATRSPGARRAPNTADERSDLATRGGGRGDAGEVKVRVTAAVEATGSWTVDIVPVLEEAARAVSMLDEKIEELVTILSNLSDGGGVADFLLECGSASARLKETAGALRSFITGRPGFCRWIETRRGRGGLFVSLCQAPLSAGDRVRSALLAPHKTVVMTSATLAVGRSFGYLYDRIGIRDDLHGRLADAILDSPFDFQTHVLLGVPVDIPEPNQEGFADDLASLVLRAVRISKGRAFVLFTSYSLLNRLFSVLRESIESDGYVCLKQGASTRRVLLERFVSESPAVLFGTDSFWEGVDVKGEELSCVILTRLPFRVPTEPILEARMESIAMAGGDPFTEFSLPQAVIKFKQGFGRLIRHREDRGAVLIFDPRLERKTYGRVFLESLPKTRRVTGEREAVFDEMARFFDEADALVRKRGRSRP